MVKVYDFGWIIAVFILRNNMKTSADYREQIKRNQSAVTSPTNLEDFYVRIKREIPLSYMHRGDTGQLKTDDYWSGNIIVENYRYITVAQVPHMRAAKATEYDLEDKSKICAQIFNSGFFEWFEQQAVEFNIKKTKLMEELRENYPDIYKNIYRNWPNLMPGEWMNPMKARKLYVNGEEYEEKVFSCLVRDKKSERPTSYIEYFVSGIYQSDSPKNTMDGRFIFTLSKDNQLKLFALAEEVGQVDGLMVKKTHKAYFEERDYVHRDPPNPVCTLSTSDKIRLCTQVLNAVNFPDKIKFIPEPQSIEPDCKKQNVKIDGMYTEYGSYRGFLAPYSTVRNFFNVTYKESMMRCKGFSIIGKTNEPATSITYHISRGRERNTIIVFKSLNEDFVSAKIGITGIRFVSTWDTYMKPVSAKIIKTTESY